MECPQTAESALPKWGIGGRKAPEPMVMSRVIALFFLFIFLLPHSSFSALGPTSSHASSLSEEEEERAIRPMSKREAQNQRPVWTLNMMAHREVAGLWSGADVQFRCPSIIRNNLCLQDLHDLYSSLMIYADGPMTLCFLLLESTYLSHP